LPHDLDSRFVPKAREHATTIENFGETKFRSTRHHAVFRKTTDAHLHRDLKTRRVRPVGVSLSGVTHGANTLDLLHAGRREQKCRKLTQSYGTQLRNRFGFFSTQVQVWRLASAWGSSDPEDAETAAAEKTAPHSSFQLTNPMRHHRFPWLRDFLYG